MYDQGAAAIEMYQGDFSNRWSNSDRRFDEMLAVFLGCFCCLSMFCEVRVTKPAQAQEKKKQTTKCTKPAQAPKKNTKKSRNYDPLLSSCWIFFWCLSMFGASSGCFFFVFVGACQCFVQSESPNLHRHQKKTKKNPGNMGPPLSSCWMFLVFFGACRCLVHLVWFFSFFCFFGACQCFVKSESPNLHRHQKKTLDAPNLHRHKKKTKKTRNYGPC